MSSREAILLLVDVGQNMEIQANSNDDSLMTLAKKCLKWIVQRKVEEMYKAVT